MKTVKFISTDPLQKQFANTVRQRVNLYFSEKGISNKGNFAMYFKAVVMLSIYITPFVLILTLTMNIWMALSLWVMLGIGAAGVGMSVMHDAAHGVFSSKTWVNKLVSSTMYMIGGNLFNWKVQHNILHHSYTNIYGMDQDIETKAVIRLCNHAPLKKYHRFQHIYAFFLYGLMTLSKLVTEFNQLSEFNSQGITAAQQRKPGIEMAKLALSKIIYLGVIIGLPIWLTDFSWWQILIGFSVMHIVAGMIMSTVFQMAHVVQGTDQPLPDKDGIIANEWMVHELNTTSDFAPKNFILNWYVGGLNFQIEHHLFPNVCHIHYPRIAPIVAQAAKDFGLHYNLQPTFISALSSHTRRLRELGHNIR